MQLVDVVNQAVDEYTSAFETWIAETQTVIAQLGAAAPSTGSGQADGDEEPEADT
jgi:hypothetical protein